MAKNYDRAGDCFQRAANTQIEQGDKVTASSNLNNAINCFNLSNPGKSSEILEQLIKIAASAGKFMQAGKAATKQAEALEENRNFVEARKTYERAAELFQSESNADSDLRNC